MNFATPAAAPASTETGMAAPAPRMIGLRIVLIIVALIEAYDGFSNVSALFGDMSEIPGPGLGGGLVKAHLAAHPVLAVAALVFAAMGRVRHALVALGTIMIMGWLSDMPSVVAHGFAVKGAFSAVETIARIVAFPLMAACAIAYAAHDRHLGSATLLVSIPTLFKVVLVVGFIVSVVKYGF